jgi:hypothetical protein
MKKLIVLMLALFWLAGVLAALDSKFLRVVYQSKTPVANNVSVTDKYAFINNDWQLYVYSVNSGWNPLLETAFSSSYPITDVFSLDNNRIYICSHEPTNDVAEIDSLNTYGRIYLANRLTCDKARREGATLYTSNAENGLEIYDIGKGVAPQLISAFSGKWGFVDMEARYPYVHALNNFGYVIIDITDLTQPRSVGTNYEIVDGRVLCVNRNIAWIGAAGTLFAVDFTYSDKPVIINRYRFSADITDIQAKGNDLYVGLKTSGLKIMDITYPKMIKEKNSFYLKTAVTSIAVLEDYIYVGAGLQGWVILEYR